MKKITIIMLIVLSAIGISYAQKSTGTVTSTDSIAVDISTDVPVYEYKPKVIIQGKWGAGPGEFGAIDPMQAEYFGVAQYPASLAVNSKGEIYILDQLNNRIQKFSKEGKYIESILVLGCTDEKENNIVKVETFPSGDSRFDIENTPNIIGINIVIDSNDTLYYYLKRSSYTAEGAKISETGEVWEFRDDKLVKKWEVPEKAEIEFKTYGLILRQKNIKNKYFPPELENKFLLREKNIVKIKTKKEKELSLYLPNGRELKISARKNENLNSEKLKKHLPWVYDDVIITSDNYISFPIEDAGRFYTNYYDLDGNLKKKFDWKSFPKISTDLEKDGKMYLIQNTEKGIEVIKYDLVKVN